MIAGELSTADNMLPVSSDLITWLNVDYRLGLGASTTTNQIVAVHILYRVVVIWCAQGYQLTSILSSDRNPLLDD